MWQQDQRKYDVNLKKALGSRQAEMESKERELPWSSRRACQQVAANVRVLSRHLALRLLPARCWPPFCFCSSSCSSSWLEAREGHPSRRQLPFKKKQRKKERSYPHLNDLENPQNTVKVQSLMISLVHTTAASPRCQLCVRVPQRRLGFDVKLLLRQLLVHLLE